MSTSAKVIPFQKGYAGKATNGFVPVKQVKPTVAVKQTYSRPAKSALLMMVSGLRYALFLVMGWLRPLVRVSLMIFSGLALLAVMVMYFVVPEGQPNKWFVLGIVAAVSFACFVLAYVYDRILLSLDPALSQVK